ncbi:hypothetical protein EXIGLDRAFT_718699 [Exidia glandulosa HHB12029]|uniref:Nucleolar 27S pre-rRNA processing Urb2/Npa2 C-terminal domain-containing protein n=1 Tax=Exidia glandulosa HHB12029 TaxID=1314781 RepID=A0A165HKE9_EXIGL|nr:hypothetical protein EXIGLDRAFT_718699 [Exidia glandulosa HHB12029]
MSLSSAHAFIRALKAQTDPPPAESRQKIDLARDAWHTQSLYVPSKPEVLVDWLLSHLLKFHDALRDIRYWTLLDEIFQHDERAKNQRAWLLPILNRIPTVPILSSFLGQLAQHHTSSVSGDLVRAVTRCYAVIWPLAVPKANHDALVECFWVLLTVVASSPAATNDLPIGELANMISAQFTKTFASSPSKRKICTTFMLDKHVEHWLRAITRGSSDVRVATYGAVSDMLFSVEGIRHLILVPEESADRFFSKLSDLGPVPGFAQTCLPDLFSSFAQAVRKHRSALFAEGSNASGSGATTVDEACVSFFSSCVAYIGQCYDGTGEQWPAHIRLLDAVRSANLYSRGSAWRNELIALTLKAAGALDTQNADSAFAVLTSLLRLDYDIVADICPHVIKLIAFAADTSLGGAADFASNALEYASKTRTVDEHLLMVSTCLRAEQPDAKQAYMHACRGIFFSHAWRTQMKSAVEVFLSPGQAAHLATETLAAVQAEWESTGARLRVPAKKKSKAGSQDVTAFALSLYFAADVLSALFVRSLSVDAPQEEHVIKLVQILDEVDTVLSGQLAGSWERQTLQACTLRCRYAVATVWPSSVLSSVPAVLDAMFTAEVDVPELRFELDRTLLRLIPAMGGDKSQKVDALLKRLARDMDPEVAWDGSVCISADSPSCAAIAATAAWSSVIHRWLPILDTYTTGPQLRALVKLMFQTYRASVDTHDRYTAGTLLQRALNDASLWELRNIREQLVEQLSDDTKSLVDVDVSKAIKSSKGKKKSQLGAEDYERTLSAFRFAFGMPPAVLPKAAREELLSRAFTADVIYKSASHRVDIRRCIAHHAAGGFISLALEIALHFIDCDNAEDGAVPGFAEVTLEVADLLFARACAEASSDAAQAYAAHFADVLKNSARRCNLSLDERLAAKYLKHLSPSMAASGWAQEFLRVVAAHVDGIGRRLQQSADDLLQVVHALGLATAATRAARRLGVSLSAKLDFAASVLPQVVKTLHGSPELRSRPEALALCTQLLVLLFTNLSHGPEGAITLVAAFATFSRLLGLERLSTAADEQIIDTLRTLPLASYQVLLKELQDAIHSLPRDRSSDICAVIRLSTLLCREVPEGASKLARDHARACLTTAANDGFARHQDPSVRLQVLRLIETMCRDRPMSLQLQDVGQVWLLLAHILAPSTSHDERTSSAHFHAIVATATSMVRLRRDLVAPTLPHLTHVLRLLVGALRAPRPQLGAKQLRDVCNDLPRFVSARSDGTGALGPDEARALARLMTVLSTKTTIVGRSDDRVPASLTRPFARHAPGVLLAYVKAASAPLSVLSLAIRRELEPGVFALCAMSGEHGRDSIMAGTAGAPLDAAGKAVFKTVWKEFEKQKYVGTG